MGNQQEKKLIEMRQLLTMVAEALDAGTAEVERNYVRLRIEKWLDDNKPMSYSDAIRKWK